MATPRGAKHYDVEQRLRDLEDQVRRLSYAALNQRQASVTDGELVVSGGGTVVVQDGGTIVVDGHDMRPPRFLNTDTDTYVTGDMVLTLSHIPDPLSLQVKWRGVELEPADWSLTDNVLTIADTGWFEAGDQFSAWYAYDPALGVPETADITFVDYSPGGVGVWTVPDLAVSGNTLIAAGMVPDGIAVSQNGWDLVGESGTVTHAAVFGTFTYRLVVLSKHYDGSSTVPTVAPGFPNSTCLMVAFDGGNIVEAEFTTNPDSMTANSPANPLSSLRVWGTIGPSVTITPSQGTSVGYVGGDDIDIAMTLDPDTGLVSASTGANAGWCTATITVR